MRSLAITALYAMERGERVQHPMQREGLPLTWFGARRKASGVGEGWGAIWVQPFGLQLCLLQGHFPLLHFFLQEVVIWLKNETTFTTRAFTQGPGCQAQRTRRGLTFFLA